VPGIFLPHTLWLPQSLPHHGIHFSLHISSYIAMNNNCLLPENEYSSEIRHRESKSMICSFRCVKKNKWLLGPSIPVHCNCSIPH
jgi:hypothetical protein